MNDAKASDSQRKLNEWKQVAMLSIGQNKLIIQSGDKVRFDQLAEWTKQWNNKKSPLENYWKWIQNTKSTIFNCAPADFIVERERCSFVETNDDFLSSDQTGYTELYWFVYGHSTVCFSHYFFNVLSLVRSLSLCVLEITRWQLRVFVNNVSDKQFVCCFECGWSPYLSRKHRANFKHMQAIE